MWWRYLFISLAYFLLSAHFLRYGQTGLCVAFGLSPLLLFVKSAWVTRILQAGLLISAILVWGVSSYEYVQMRISMEAPWIRLSAIMSAVVCYTLFSAWCCNAIVKKRNQRSLFH